MDQLELNRERRKQRALERLGNEQSAMCHSAAATIPWRLELHHIAGAPSMTKMVPVCRNCHRLLSDWQKDHPASVGDPPNDLERIGHSLLGLADMFELLVKWLREFATKLFAAD